MKTSGMLVAAAVAGLFAGAASARAAAPTVGSAGRSVSSSAPTSRLTTNFAGTQGGAPFDADAGKHDCKGKNGCKGEGGCSSGDNGCKGKNSCKGKGGCNTNSTTQPSKL